MLLSVCNARLGEVQAEVKISRRILVFLCLIYFPQYDNMISIFFYLSLLSQGPESNELTNY